jgi:RND family efflux transporter MFP subunit
MKNKILVPIAVLVVAAIGAFILVATAPSVEHVSPERAITAVRTREPKPQSVRLLVRSQGTVAPRTESALVPEVSGRVVWISPALVSGGFFEIGEPLLRIERRIYEMAVDRAKAAVTRALSEFDYADDELERQKGLSARDVASTSQLSQARRTRRVADASLTEARVALEQAEWELERTEILAPFEGRVREERVDVGQVVSRGASLGTIYATDHVEIRLPVADHQLAYLDLPRFPRRASVAAGSTDGVAEPAAAPFPIVRLRARFAGQEHEWTGYVVRTEGEIDARSRMVHVVARVDDPYGMKRDRDDKPPLAVGLFVRAEIEGPLAEDVIVVPRYALRDARHILIVDAEDRLHTREVEVLRIDGDDVLIQGALAPGERICVSPLQIVVEGMRVRPMPDDDDDDAAAPVRGSVRS